MGDETESTEEVEGRDANDRMVPLDALESERSKRQQLEKDLAELKGRLDGMSQQNTEKSKEYSRADLSRFVDDGQMTQTEADQIWERQIEERITRKAEEIATQKVEQHSSGTRVQQEVDRYKEAIPEVLKDGTEQRRKVESEYQYLVSIGHDPKSLSTELAALRAAFGPVEKQGKRQRETHQETGGGEPSEQEGPKNLSNRRKQFYARQISKGVYSGWDDPKLKAELEYA